MRARSLLLVVALAASSLLLMGMGGFGGSDVVSKIPEPDRPFTVHIVDAENVSYTVSDFSVDGLTYAPATLGKADVGIDFATISKVRLFREGADGMRADVGFKDGTAKQVHIGTGVLFYGRTSWGLMRLAAKDIREIDFQ